ncbi:hypothetical protein DL769_002654 [Monosporascus sp. CRB-8-3]|nr:hypothetical protein DL769_002654 [Monosporascus sp. CRB-8-3]
MHWSGFFTFAVCASTVAAHAAAHEPHQPVPRVWGNRKLLSELGVKRGSPALPRKPRQPEPIEEYTTDDHEKRGEIEERQNVPERRLLFLRGISYGPACDGNQRPDGVDTSTVPRPKVGSVPYGGVGIYDCETVGDIAITFDDGPWDYTSDLLDMFAEYNAKATFFITGTNLHKGKLNDPALPAWQQKAIRLQAIPGRRGRCTDYSRLYFVPRLPVVGSGNEAVTDIGITDENFSQTSATQARNQMIWNEIALNDILGYIPTYMRPPYSICPESCQNLMAELGYHIVYFDLDTEGYLHTEPSQIQRSKDIWDDAVEGTDACATGYLQIEHDIHYQVVYNLTGHLLESLFRNGYRSVTVGECLGDPPENWYRAGPGGGSVPPYTHEPPTPTCGPGGGDPPPPTQTSVEGNCGAGITCLGSEFGDCCSQHGWCGSTAAYCGEGCQSAFGTCDGGSGGGGGGGGGAPVSEDGSCGGADGVTCVGSEFGNCCSQYGWCGSSADHCGTGCQPEFGSGCG